MLFAVQEEIGLYGARFVSAKKLGSPKYCFNWDGGDPCYVNVGATGDYGMEINIHGIASHAGVHPERGVSAIAVAALAIADLTQNGWHGLVHKGRHWGTSNVGFIAGGEATNVITPLVRLRAEARSHDPVFRKRIVDAYRKALLTRRLDRSNPPMGNPHMSNSLRSSSTNSFRLNRDEPAYAGIGKHAAVSGCLG